MLFLPRWVRESVDVLFEGGHDDSVVTMALHTVIDLVQGPGGVSPAVEELRDLETHLL
jgi:hypothetical protein